MYPHIKMHNGFEEFAKKKEKLSLSLAAVMKGNMHEENDKKRKRGTLKGQTPILLAAT